MNQAKEIQLTFINRIKASIPSHMSLVDELAELLHTSNDSAYRRIRGETMLSIDEIAKICTHFKVAFDTQSQPDTPSATFNYFRMEGKEANFKKWFLELCYNVKHIGSVQPSDILYSADDAPIWHHFYHDELTSFKIFYWLKSILNDPFYADKQYDPALIDPELIIAARELLDNYNQINSVEVWNEDTLNATLKQIEYFWESGFFKSKKDALSLCDLIQGEVDLIRLKAERETKLLDTKGLTNSNFKLYRSEVMIGNNSIVVNIGNSKVAYVSINSINMMSTTNPEFVDENERWLKNLIRKSILISGVSEKQRNQFFKILGAKIDHLREGIR